MNNQYYCQAGETVEAKYINYLEDNHNLIFLISKLFI